MKSWKKLRRQKWVEIDITLITIVIFFMLYSLIGKFCLENWLKSLLSICISISTSALFYFIGKKVNDDSFKGRLTERYIHDFQHIKFNLDKNEHSLWNYYYKKELCHKRHTDPCYLILENNIDIFNDLDNESFNLYRDLKARIVNPLIIKAKIYHFLVKIIRDHLYGLTYAKMDEVPYYRFKNPKKLLKELKKL